MTDFFSLTFLRDIPGMSAGLAVGALITLLMGIPAVFAARFWGALFRAWRIQHENDVLRERLASFHDHEQQLRHRASTEFAPECLPGEPSSCTRIKLTATPELALALALSPGDRESKNQLQVWVTGFDGTAATACLELVSAGTPLKLASGPSGHPVLRDPDQPSAARGTENIVLPLHTGRGKQIRTAAGDIRVVVENGDAAAPILALGVYPASSSRRDTIRVEDFGL